MNTKFKRPILFLPFFLFVFLPFFSNAHAPDQSYIFLRVYENAIEGRFELTTGDLNKALNLQLQQGLSNEDVAPYLSRIKSYVLERSSFASSLGNHAIQFTASDILKMKKFGDYVQLNFTLDGITEIPDALDVKYNALFDKDDNHSGILVVEYNWKAGTFDNESIISLIFEKGDISQSLDLTEASIWKGFWAMIKMGVWHIWIGIDHILFILALVLPSVVRRLRREDSTTVADENAVMSFANASGVWTPVERFKPAFMYMVKIITFFTIAHTITLSLASLEIVDLSSRLVESVIAFSIALAAYHNIRPIFKGKDWLIAFGFGLFHGFGFASVLGEIGLTGEFMTLSLLGFNLGVELGQVAIICVIFPILFYLRQSKHYPKILVYGSILLIFIALYWVVERVFDIDLLLDNYIYEVIRGGFKMIGVI